VLVILGYLVDIRVCCLSVSKDDVTDIQNPIISKLKLHTGAWSSQTKRL